MMKMRELTPVHAAVLAVLVLLLLGLAAVNMMVNSGSSNSTHYLSGGVVEGSEDLEQIDDSTDTRRFLTP